ncbi:hypothetical protein EVAR_14389_1 [Eumeta japonica]|uniref:Mariner Mos1 transposase n=1 Tax=Eumeta variegata TaxID=151549 RepID=A0A4C1TX58_EUMVA|nr:hypothetical protein EVAR_14389_1 [Eumeta japonica]
MTKDRISAVQLMVETDKRVTYQQIRTIIGMSQVHKVLHKHIAVRKLCTWWIPHSLTEAQKPRRVNCCREMIESFAGGDSNAVHDMVTDDQNRIYCYTIPKKIDSLLSGCILSSYELKVKRSQSVG